MLFRSVVAVIAFLLVTIGSGDQASAHGGGGNGATNYLIDVHDPGVDGIGWRIYGGDALVRMSNRTGEDVRVHGYQGEPYLWFRADGAVLENQSSPAAWLNEDRDGQAAVPPGVEADGPPRWTQVSSDGSFVWHDHRMHWMGGPTPAAVVAQPDREHVIHRWTVPLTVGGAPEEANGELRWVPPTSAVPYIAGTAAVMLLATGVAVIASGPGNDRWPGLGRTVGALVLAVVTANAVRTLDDMLAFPASWTTHVVVSLIASTCLIIIAVLAIRGSRGHGRGFAALAVAGLLAMLFFGAEATDELAASQLLTVLPPWFRRVTVAASWTILLPTLFAAGLAANRYASRSARDRSGETHSIH